jgi:RND family efflux transporter MFP subunit
MPSARSVIVLAALLGACSAAKEGGGGPKHGPPLVRTAVARPEPVEDVIELAGTLAGSEAVTVAAQVEAPVASIAADLGDRVKKGDPLVRLDVEALRLRADQAEADYRQALARLGPDPAKFDPEQAAAVRKARSDLEAAKRDLGRIETLAKQGMAAQGDLDAVRTRAAVAEAALQDALEGARAARATAASKRAAAELARKQVRDGVIRSPVDGAVAKRLVAPGEYVKVGQPVARVVVTDPLKLEAEVPELYAGVVKPGQAVEIRSDALPGEPLQGKVTRVSPEVSTSSRTFTVEAQVPDPQGRLKPGLFAHAELHPGHARDLFALPETAVVSVAGVVKVFVVRDGKAAERKVEVVRKRGSDALVSGELAAGDAIVTMGVAQLHDGAAVEVEAP